MNSELFDFYEQDAVTEAEKLVAEGRILRFKKELTADGRIRLSGRYADHFNFVDRAQVIVSADGSCVDSSRCDCSGSRSTTSFCCHCAALLLLLEEQEEPAPAVSAAFRFDFDDSEARPAPMRTAPARPAESYEAGQPLVDAAGEPGPSFEDLHFSFCNCSQDLYPGEDDPQIPLERYQLIFGETPFAKTEYYNQGDWNGNCHGMVAASGMFYHPGNSISVPDFRRGASVPSQLQLGDRNRGLDLTLKAFIEAMQISQSLPSYSQAVNKTLEISLPERLKMLCDKVRNFEATGMAPAIMGLWWDEYSPKDKAYNHYGHSVLPFRYQQLDGLRSRLHIYDPNVPDQVRYCELLQDPEGNYQSWRFIMADNTELSSENEAEIEFDSHELYQSVWDKRGDREALTLFSTNNANLTLQDEAGTEVLKISAGRMRSLRDDVIPVRMKGGRGGYARECWLRPGTYRVINEDPERTLSFAFTGEKTETEVETEAEEAVVTLNEEEKVRKVQIAEEEKPLLVRLTDEDREILLKAVSPAGGAIIENILGKLLLRFLAREYVESFQIDGEDADVTEFLEELEAELEEEPGEEDEELLIANKAAHAADKPEASDPDGAATGKPDGT